MKLNGTGKKSVYSLNNFKIDVKTYLETISKKYQLESDTNYATV